MDAIVSAIGYAEYKRALGWEHVIPARAGSVNERVAFALEKFGFEAPIFLSDLSPKVEDVMGKNVLRTRIDAPIQEAIKHIRENRFRGLPVVDEEGRIAGLISSFKISSYLFPAANGQVQAREVHASLADICATFGGTPVGGSLNCDVRVYSLMIAAMKPETFSSRLAALGNPRGIVLFVGDRADIIDNAIRLGVGAIVLTGGLNIPEELIAPAKKAGVSLIESPQDTATSVLLSRSAMQVRLLLDEEFTSFAPETPLDEARAQVAMSNEFVFPVIDENRKLEGILSKGDFIRPVQRRLILMDHNEMSQAVPGATEIPILEIIDHHRISTITTDLPILFLNRPVGSTSTIVASCFLESNLPIPKPIAGLLMCGLLSDTLNLTSPTTTDVDREIMTKLQNLTGLDPTGLANEIFSVGSPLLTMSAEAAITADRKSYEERGRKFSIAQIEELTFTHFPEKQYALLEALAKHRESSGFYFAALLVTDINTQKSVLLVAGAESFIKLIDYPEAGENMWVLDGIVSRKKQLLPYLVTLLTRAGSKK